MIKQIFKSSSKYIALYVLLLILCNYSCNKELKEDYIVNEQINKLDTNFVSLEDVYKLADGISFT